MGGGPERPEGNQVRPLSRRGRERVAYVQHLIEMGNVASISSHLVGSSVPEATKLDLLAKGYDRRAAIARQGGATEDAWHKGAYFIPPSELEAIASEGAAAELRRRKEALEQ